MGLFKEGKIPFVDREVNNLLLFRFLLPPQVLSLPNFLKISFGIQYSCSDPQLVNTYIKLSY